MHKYNSFLRYACMHMHVHAHTLHTALQSASQNICHYIDCFFIFNVLTDESQSTASDPVNFQGVSSVLVAFSSMSLLFVLFICIEASLTWWWWWWRWCWFASLSTTLLSCAVFLARHWYSHDFCRYAGFFDAQWLLQVERSSAHTKKAHSLIRITFVHAFVKFIASPCRRPVAWYTRDVVHCFGEDWSVWWTWDAVFVPASEVMLSKHALFEYLSRICELAWIFGNKWWKLTCNQVLNELLVSLFLRVMWNRVFFGNSQAKANPQRYEKNYRNPHLVSCI